MKNILILGSIGAAIGVSIILFGSLSYFQIYNQSLLRQTSDTYKIDFPECFSDKQLSELKFRGRTTTGCNLDSFEPSSSVYHLAKTQAALCHLGDPIENVSGPPELKRVGGVSFILSSEVFPESEWHNYHCAYNITVKFRNGEFVQFEFSFNQNTGPFRIKESDYPRYEARLTIVERGRPIAGMIHDTETNEMYYLVTKWIF